MKTLHIEGFAKDIDLCAFFSDNYDHDLGFSYEEESEDTMPRMFFRFYTTDKKCTLEEAMKGHLEKMFGSLTAKGQEYGYSEVTIEGFTVSSLKLGGHDLGGIIASNGRKYMHILIDQVEKEKM